MLVVVALFAASCGGGPAAPPAEDTVTVKVSTLTFPSLVAVLPPLIQQQGIDEKHGINLEIQPFGDIGAFYAATTNASVDAAVGGPTVLQRLVNEGAKIQIVASYVGLKPLVVITADPDIQSVADLNGRSLAATVASSEFQVLAIYALSKGVDLTTDTELINAGLAEVRTMLEAGRVDAAMLWEPAASLALAERADYRIIFNGDEAWREVTGEKGWELVWAIQRPLIEQHPGVVDRFIAMLQEGVDWLFANVEEAGRIMEEATGMPPDAFVSVLEEGRVDYDVRPAWDPDVKASLQAQFQAAVDHGYLEALPPADIILEPSS